MCEQTIRRLLVIVVVMTSGMAGGVGVAAAMDDPRLETGRALFEEAAYDSALVVLESVSADAAIPEYERGEAYRLMGLIYTLKGDLASARMAIRRWIDLAPSTAVPDPDRDLLAFVHLFFEARKEYNEQRFCPPEFSPPDPCQYIINRPDPGVKTVAIVDFDNNAIDDRSRLEPLRGGLADLMIRQLSGTIGLEIVEREWLRWLLHEIELSRTGKMDPQTAIRVGHLIGAHAILLGDFMYLNNTLTIGARLVKVETGSVLLVASEDGRLNAFSNIAGKLSEKIARASERKIKRGEWKGRTPSESLGALLSYAEGLALYDEGEYVGAAAKFSEALEQDPGHGPARMKYETLQPMLTYSSVTEK